MELFKHRTEKQTSQNKAFERDVTKYRAILSSPQYNEAYRRLQHSVNNDIATGVRKDEPDWEFVRFNLAQCAGYANADIMEAIGEAFLHGISYEEYVNRAGVDVNDERNGRALEAPQWWIITAGVLSNVNVRIYTKQLPKRQAPSHLASDGRFLGIEADMVASLAQHSDWFRTKERFVPGEPGGIDIPHTVRAVTNKRNCVFSVDVTYQEKRPFYTWEQMQLLYYAIVRGLPTETLEDTTIPVAIGFELLYGLADGVDLKPYFDDIVRTLRKETGTEPLIQPVVVLLRDVHYGLLSGLSEEEVKSVYTMKHVRAYVSDGVFPAGATWDQIIAAKSANRMHRMERAEV
jgi:hypothetical protein